MKIITLFTLFLCLTFPSFLSAADAPDVQTELKKLTGTWTFVSMSGKDTAPFQEQLKPALFVFTADKIAIKMDGETVQELSYKIDTSTTPWHLDLTMPAPAEGKPLIEEGIYELKADTLRICSSKAGEKRPSDFEIKEESKVELLTLKRKKD